MLVQVDTSRAQTGDEGEDMGGFEDSAQCIGRRDPRHSGMLGDVAEAEPGRLRGVLIIESLRPVAELTDLAIAVSTISRIRPEIRGAGQPDTWTLIHFEADVAAAERLAAIFADTLEAGPWYIDFHTATTTYVVFSGRVFSYSRNEPDGRDNAIAHARAVGIPEAQLDWS
ncbi:hypothetical protein [Nocardia cerradoensis]|uniref:hypothetical protein n=1 Tax=Nocardia cerradoensis TaxID=85688 RepID=UPI0002E61BC5|nr:hypothetical protein [Nocardia cerradoensis]